MNIDLAKKKWKSHRANAVNLKKVAALSFDEYVQKLVDAGIGPEQVGVRNGEYQLSRYTDTGSYTPDSCRFILKQQNYAEQIKNGGIARGAEKKRGRTAETHSGLSIMADKKSKPFAFMAPDGVVHQGRNLYRFCLENGLNQGNMVEVRNGKKNSCKGWVQAF